MHPHVTAFSVIAPLSPHLHISKAYGEYMPLQSSCWDMSQQWSLYLTNLSYYTWKQGFFLKKSFLLSRFLWFSTIIVNKTLHYHFIQQTSFQGLSGRAEIVVFGMLWERGLMGGLRVGWNIELGLGEESCFCTAGNVQEAEIGIKKWSIKYFFAF